MFTREFARLGGGAALVLTLAAVFLSACGMLIDKDRIVVAKFGDSKITRGDLFTYIRRMSDTERPRIRNKSDLLDVLNKNLDDRVRLAVADRFASNAAEFAEVAQQIYVPMGLAIQRYIAESGDEGQMIRMILTSPLPDSGEETPLMKEFNMSHAQWRARRDYYEIKAEDLRDKMQGDAAIMYLGAKDYQAGKLAIDPAKVEREYTMKKEAMRKMETLAFFAIEFPAALPDATANAAKTRARIDAGESFDTVAAEFQAHDPNSVSNSAIENNPNLEKFRTFWNEATGAEPGKILGPVFLPSSGRVRIGADGKPVQYRAPDSYLVLKVLEHTPERVLTLQEAQPDLMPDLIYAEKLKALRKEYGAEIYEDQLPDPRGGGGAKSTGDPVLGY